VTARIQHAHDICKCYHTRGDHRRDGSECLLDDCDCIAFVMMPRPKTSMPVHVREYVARVAKSHAVSLQAVMSTARHPAVCRARDQAMAVLRWTCNYSFPELGAMFGRDHTSVMAAVERYEARLNTEAAS
jgi:hypothetical protein